MPGPTHPGKYPDSPRRFGQDERHRPAAVVVEAWPREGVSGREEPRQVGAVDERTMGIASEFTSQCEHMPESLAGADQHEQDAEPVVGLVLVRLVHPEFPLPGVGWPLG